MTRSFIVVALFALCSCVSVGGKERPSQEIYVVKARGTEVGRTSLAVRVMEPQAGPGLDTKRIAVMDAPNHLTYYTGVAWSQPLPAMLQGVLTDALTQSQAFKSVSTDRDMTQADVIINSTIRDYQVVLKDKEASVQVRLDVKLIGGYSRDTLKSFTVNKTQKAKANHMPEIMDAFDEATSEAVSDIARAITRRASR
jgi:cholesterol transport system auxiliary component